MHANMYVIRSIVLHGIPYQIVLEFNCSLGYLIIIVRSTKTIRLYSVCVTILDVVHAH